MRRQFDGTAYWTQHTHLFSPDEYECSACGYETDRPYRECPSCHAEMTKSKYDPSWVDEAVILDILDGEF
jgi:rubrerythrin